MVDTKTSAETNATALDGTELIRIVQGGFSKKTTLSVFGKQFRGAKAIMTANPTINTSGGVELNFNYAEVDTDAFWSAGLPSRLTIPSGLGMSLVKLDAQVFLVSLTSGAHSLRIIQRDSSGVIKGIFGVLNISHGNATYMKSVKTGVVPVEDGDYFTLQLTDAFSPDIGGHAQAHVYLSLQVLRMEQV